MALSFLKTTAISSTSPTSPCFEIRGRGSFLFALVFSALGCVCFLNLSGLNVDFGHNPSKTDPLTTQLTLALCLITRDEGITGDLLEWVEYHKSIGVTKIIIVENDSNDTASGLISLSPHIKSGFIYRYSFFSQQEYVRYPPPKDKVVWANNQIWAYDYCLRNYGSKFSHMGFIDTDEFIVIADTNSTIIDVLEKYREYGGLVINWMFIGSNGHKARPPGGVLRNYNKCVRNCHVKTIVNTRAVARTSNTPHHFVYRNGKYAVDSNFERVDGPFNPPHDRDGRLQTPPADLYSVVHLNHYVLKSESDFERKTRRGSGDGGNKTMAWFFETDKGMTDDCPLLSPRTPPLVLERTN